MVRRNESLRTFFECESERERCKEINFQNPYGFVVVFLINASEFRKGVWGITLFSPEKGFPQKNCPDKTDFRGERRFRSCQDGNNVLQ